MDSVTILGFDVFDDDLSKINFEGKKVVNTISPNSYGISTTDREFKLALQKSDILTLDGEYFGLAAILLKRRVIKRYQGMDNFRCFMHRANLESARVFFLGSSQTTLRLIKSRAQVDYPNVFIDYYSPPYKSAFTSEDNDEMIKRINAFSPQLLCIGMTAPKQEKWVAGNIERLNVNIVLTIGQVFDWYAGSMKEPALLWKKFHLLWLARTIRRPEILKRYPMVFKFAWHLFLNIIHIRKD